jgi:hypothetical protein
LFSLNPEADGISYAFVFHRLNFGPKSEAEQCLKAKAPQRVGNPVRHCNGNNGGDTMTQVYGTAHNANGDLSYFCWEGTSKVTPKEGGAFEITGNGKFNWLGGTGEYQKISGGGTYTCKGNQTGVECPWKANPRTKCQ